MGPRLGQRFGRGHGTQIRRRMRQPVMHAERIRRLAPFASLYVPGSVRAFPLDRLPHAVAWLST